jgi:hypothetical protein
MRLQYLSVILKVMNKSSLLECEAKNTLLRKAEHITCRPMEENRGRDMNAKCVAVA